MQFSMLEDVSEKKKSPNASLLARIIIGGFYEFPTNIVFHQISQILKFNITF